jgi:crotonobetainyl-CoA hydratase
VTTAISNGSPAALLERRGHIAVITLNRPAAMNAVNSALSIAVGDALAEIAADPSIRAGVITGAGRAFCAGADLKEIAAGRSVYDPNHLERGFAGFVRHFVDKPLIAAVNGFALGGGTEIVLACDLAVVSDQATFGLPEVTRGLIAGAGGLLRLHRQIPAKVAAEAVLTGAPMDAQAALRWGLVNRVVPPGEVLGTALDLATVIAANAPLAVRASKRVIARSAETGSDWGDVAWEMNNFEFTEVRSSKDAREGATAFSQKRRPEWSGS